MSEFTLIISQLHPVLAVLVFRHSSRPRHICHFFLSFTGKNFDFQLFSILATKMSVRSRRVWNASEPTTVTRLCVGTRQGVGRAWFPRHASWEQAGRMGHGHATSRLRASHVAHAISVRVRLCPRRPVATNSALRVLSQHPSLPHKTNARTPTLLDLLHRWTLSQKICRPREHITT